MKFVTLCKMQKSVLVLIVFLTLSCLSFNYTFPLHRDIEDPNFLNGTQCNNHNIGDVVDRTKKMAVNVFKRLKNSSPDEVKETPEDVDTSAKDKASVTTRQTDEKVPISDIRHFEQLVIMKKYPYLDLKEFEAKYTLSPDHARHNQKLYPGFNIGNDPGICERQAVEADNLSVEVSNRGLSGFAIPKIAERKSGQELVASNRTVQINVALPSKGVINVVESLKNDVAEYLKDKSVDDKIKETNE